MSCLRFFFAWLMLIGSFSTATAAPITNIYNTGVNNAGNALPGPNIVDPHYSIIAPPNFLTVTVDDTNYPFPAWVANNSGSRWISRAFDANGPAAPYIYRTNFTVPANAILSTVSVTGDWATDNPGTDIRINGLSTGQTNLAFNSFAALVPFSITSGFVHGNNTLDFYVTNWDGPTGLRVDHIAGSYQIPEPASIVLVIGLLAACGGMRLRRRCELL